MTGSTLFIARGVALFTAAAFSSFAQAPVINPGGVVNAATYHAPSGIAAGSIASIFGQRLSARSESATATPLPTTLAGTSVIIDGVTAPLFFVSPNQVNFQVPNVLLFPSEGKVARKVPVIVRTSIGTSSPVEVQLENQSLGIFTLDASGCGRAAILNRHADGSWSVNGPEQSAEPGGVITVFYIGTGWVAPPLAPPDGTPTPSTPPGRPILPSWQAAVQLFASVYTGLFSGRAPGLIGVDQWDLALPADVQEGCSVPLAVASGLASSQQVPISIRAGGGRCVDPPPASLAEITWRKTVTSRQSGVQMSDSAEIRITRAINNTFLPLTKALAHPLEPTPAGWIRTDRVPVSGPQCIVVASENLNAGTLRLQGPPGFEPVSVEPGPNGRYQATLTPGAIVPGPYRVTASSGANVGAFESNVRVPPFIRVTTNLSPGTPIRLDRDITVAWEGGDAETIVRMRVHTFQGGPIFHEVSVLATAGRATLPLPGRLAGLAAIEITVMSEGNQVSDFTAAGLDKGGKHRWIYTYRYEDLNGI